MKVITVAAPQWVRDVLEDISRTRAVLQRKYLVVSVIRLHDIEQAGHRKGGWIVFNLRSADTAFIAGIRHPFVLHKQMAWEKIELAGRKSVGRRSSVVRLQ